MANASPINAPGSASGVSCGSDGSSSPGLSSGLSPGLSPGLSMGALASKAGRSYPIRWGLIGGGRDSQIGSAHRIGAQMDGHFVLRAGAFDIDAAQNRAFGAELGLPPERVYDDWETMLEQEAQRPDGIELLTIATPNRMHYPVAVKALSLGFGVFCEKPLTLTLQEAWHLRELVAGTKALFGVNFSYLGYPHIEQLRQMVLAGTFGAVRLVVMEFSHGHHTTDLGPDGTENPRIRWRYDPLEAGPSGILADCGTHPLYLARYILGSPYQAVLADFVSVVPSRRIEDDAFLALRFANGAVGRLWTSSVALGQTHGLTIRLFGEKAGAVWSQEQGNQLAVTYPHGRTEIFERGAPYLHALAQANSRVTVGQMEGFLASEANIYRELAQSFIQGRPTSALPSVEAGVEMSEIVEAAVQSARAGGRWRTLPLDPAHTEARQAEEA